jgi:hypothetical protein
MIVDYLEKAYQTTTDLILRTHESIYLQVERHSITIHSKSINLDSSSDRWKAEF